MAVLGSGMLADALLRHAPTIEAEMSLTELVHKIYVEAVVDSVRGASPLSKMFGHESYTSDYDGSFGSFGVPLRWSTKLTGITE